MTKNIWGMLLILVLVSCGKPAEKVVITFEDGVKIVRNPLLELTELDVKPELIIGEGESNDELFSNLTDIVEDEIGNIYVCDGADNNIKVYTKDGTFVKLIGREGEGPGEFREPVCVDFFSDGTMIVADQKNQRFQTFDQDGYFLKSFKIEGSSPGEFVVTSNDEIYNKPRMIFFSDNSKIPLFYKYDSQFNQLAAIGEVIDQGETFKTHLMASASITAKGDDIALAFSMINEIDIFSDTLVVEKIFRQLNYIPAKPEIKTVQEGDSVQLTAILDPICHSIDFDSKGNMYILSPAESYYAEKKGEHDKELSELYDTLLEIFSPDGEILKSIPLRGISSSTLYVGQGDKLYILDEFNMQVLRYPTLI